MLSASDRRTATMGIVLIVTIIGLKVGRPPAVRWADGRRHVAERALRDLALIRQTIDQPEETRRAIAALQSVRRTYREWVMPADSQSAIGIGLARTLSDIAEDEGVQLSSVLPLNEGKPKRWVRQVRARATFSGDRDSVLFFVAAVENRRPRLLIRQLSLSPSPAAQGVVGRIRGELVVETLVSAAGEQP